VARVFLYQLKAVAFCLLGSSNQETACLIGSVGKALQQKFCTTRDNFFTKLFSKFFVQMAFSNVVSC